MDVKRFKPYSELVHALESRGMDVGDHAAAAAQLQKVNYYRISGYWYPFRQEVPGAGRSDQFHEGTALVDVMKLYQFDARLRTATFGALTPVELYLRASLGHALGKIDECVHLRPDLLGSRACKEDGYRVWKNRYKKKLEESKEDFIVHHRERYGGKLPVWVAVEILDWGSLTYLFGYSPREIQNEIAGTFDLTSPQLKSWMRCLNFVRNVCAHHGRLFNRVHPFQPKLPEAERLPEIDAVRGSMNRTFGQLCLLQHMLKSSGNGISRMLLRVLQSYPHEVSMVPVSHMGVPDDWQSSKLWGV